MPSSQGNTVSGGKAIPSASRRAILAFGDGGYETGFLVVIIAIVTGLTVLPMGRILWEAVSPRGVFGFDVMFSVLRDPDTWRITKNTIIVGAGSTVFALLLGTSAALLVALTNIRFKMALVFCFMLPLMIPSQVSALSWIQLFDPSSAVLRFLGIPPTPGVLNPMYSSWGIMLLLGLHSSPLVFVAIRAGLRALPKEMIEACQAAGANRYRALYDVILPLMTPALVAGGALAFVSSIGNFGIPALLGIPGRYPVLSTLIYQRLFGFGPSVLPEVASIALVLTAMALVGIFVQNWIVKRHDYSVIGAAAVVLPYDLGRARILFELASWSIIFVTMVLPLFALVQASLLPAYGIHPSFSNLVLTHYEYVLLGDPDTAKAIINSFALAIGAAITLVIIATPFSYFLVWKPNWLIRFTNFAVEIPYAVPGTVVAIAAILVFLPPLPGLGFSLYNTIWIIFAAYLTRFLNRALRPIISAFQQIDRTLDEAGAACGAKFGYRMRTILLPLVGPAAMGGVLIVFLAAFNELTVSALLWSAGNETVGVMIFNLKDGGDTLEASAMAVIVLAITFVLMSVLSLMHGMVPKGVIPWRD